VTFLQLDLTNPNSIENVLSHIDYAMQYGEDEEPKEVRASLVSSPFPATLLGLVGGQAWIAYHSFMEHYVKLTVSPSIHFLVGFITAILIAPPTHSSLLTPDDTFLSCHLPTLLGRINDDPKPIYLL
jgi:hypothetical protein